LFTDAAGVREDKVDQPVPDCSDGVLGRRRRFSKPSTREDPPPLN
jgi:hypothetical protein